MTLLDKADQPQLRMMASGKGLIHVARASMPLRATTVADTDPRANAVVAKANQFADSLAAVLPQSPLVADLLCFFQMRIISISRNSPFVSYALVACAADRPERIPADGNRFPVNVLEFRSTKPIPTPRRTPAEKDLRSKGRD